MPAIEITDAKGLVQVTGTGVTSSSSVAQIQPQLQDTIHL